MLLKRSCLLMFSFLTLGKLFDSVPQQELLLKLWRIGITGNFVEVV